jgi:hypothetical protein
MSCNNKKLLKRGSSTSSTPASTSFLFYYCIVREEQRRESAAPPAKLVPPPSTIHKIITCFFIFLFFFLPRKLKTEEDLFFTHSLSRARGGAMMMPVGDDGAGEGRGELGYMYSLPAATAGGRKKSRGRRGLGCWLAGFGLACSSAYLALRFAYVGGSGGDDGVEGAQLLSALFIRDSQESLGWKVLAQSKYTDVYGPIGVDYPWVDDLNVIVEPYVPTRVVLGGMASGDAVPAILEWDIGSRFYSGPFVDVNFISVGPVAVRVKGCTAKGCSELQATLHVKYVKREVRQLFPEDLKASMDAMEVLYRVKEAEGRKLYGNGYRDIGYFVRLHNSLAGMRDCDHMHDGLGFLTQHTLLNIDFERVVRMVNPAVSLPFWDYTIDAVRMADDENVRAFYDSPLWADDIFGAFPVSGTQQADDGIHEVTHGRWANISLRAEAWGAEASPVKNGWGLLRSPWNMNAAPLLTRGRLNYGFYFDSIPDCKDHYEQMQLSTWLEFGLQIQYKPHGSIHTVIGGSWGVDYLQELSELLPWRVIRDIALRGFGLQKDLWRKGLLECPRQCDADATPETCTCYCPDLEIWLAEKQAAEVLRAVAVSDTWIGAGSEVAEALLKLLCNAEGQAPAIGDSMSSAAPIDPTFWVLHPTADRMWQWRRINGFLSTEWPEDNYRHEPGVCWGHAADDVLIWKDLLGANGKFLTNTEVYDRLDPLVPHDNTDFVFADFQWEHCAAAHGYPTGLIK